MQQKQIMDALQQAQMPAGQQMMGQQIQQPYQNYQNDGWGQYQFNGGKGRGGKGGWSGKGGKGNQVCFKCGDPSHFASHCPQALAEKAEEKKRADEKLDRLYLSVESLAARVEGQAHSMPSTPALTMSAQTPTQRLSSFSSSGFGGAPQWGAMPPPPPPQQTTETFDVGARKDTVQCTHCLRRLPKNAITAHSKTCELRTELCPNGCGAKLLVLKMQKHLEICAYAST